MLKFRTENIELPMISDPQTPPHSGNERWRALTCHISSLSSGIRGLQAKIHLLKDEYDRHLNEYEDNSDFEINLTTQYESFCTDLKALMREWEEGKSVITNITDRNEQRLSSISDIGSPTVSLGGLTVVDEDGSALEALKVLNGESRTSMEVTPPDFEEVFEAIASPHQRCLLTREERLAKMKDDRVKRHSARTSQETNTRILRELESVIKMRPKKRVSINGRITTP